MKTKDFFKKNNSDSNKAKPNTDKKKTFYSPVAKNYMKEMFSKISAIGKERNIPVLVVFLSHIPESTLKVAEVENIVKSEGLSFLNVTTSFDYKKFAEYKFNIFDGHPNDKANKIFADRIYDYLIENNLLQPTFNL